MNHIPESIRIIGGKPLFGEVTVRGAKNAIPKIMVASLLTSSPCILRNVADVEDVHVVTKMLQAMGAEVFMDLARGVVEIRNHKLKPVSIEELSSVAGKSRIPILFSGPLLVRTGEAHVPALGGCSIGRRPVDFHLSALKTMGTQITEAECGWDMKATQLMGAKIKLEYPSVGATEQVLLSSVLAKGITELSNAAVEPEIMDLIAVLQKMGAIISVDTDRVITIVGVKELQGFDHGVMTDRLESESWACAAALTRGKIFVKNARQADLMTFLNKFRQVGGMFEVKDDGIWFWRGEELTSIALETNVHPGFATDWQQPFTVLLTQARGASIVHETVYEERFGYVHALNQMGANIQLFTQCLGSIPCRFGQKNHYHSAVIMGPTPLRGSEIDVPDLRGGFSYVIAALAAEGESIIHGVPTIGRGYENFIEKLKSLGAQIS